jgi:hypothetical protein
VNPQAPQYPKPENMSHSVDHYPLPSGNAIGPLAPERPGPEQPENSRRNSQARSLPILTRRLGWTLGGLLLVCYAAVFMRLSPLALQDYPNHLARAFILSDLIFHHGARFGEQFQYHFLAIPYVLGDLALASAIAVLGTAGAAALWSTLTFLSLPAALLFYLRTTQIGKEARAVALVLSVYLATDWFFLMGFLEFRLGVAITLVILAVAERVRRNPTPAWFALYAGVLALGYLTHLTTLIFATALLAATAALRLVRRTTRGSIEAGLLVPCAIALAWHFGFAAAYRQSGDLVENPYVWGGLTKKLSGLDDSFLRYAHGLDWLMMLALGACLCLRVGRARWRDLKDPAMLEMLALAGTMLALYFILPVCYAEAYFVDVRALPLAVLFMVLTCLSIPARTHWRREDGPFLALGLAALLAFGNLGYLISHLNGYSQWLTRYRSVIAAIPRGAKVLPIDTLGADGRLLPLLHAFSFVTIDRDGLVPYLQTGDTGNAQKYIRYLHRPDAPSQTWYANTRVGPINWEAIACEYRFLLVTNPFDHKRIAVRTITAAENEAATLLVPFRPASCRAAPARFRAPTVDQPGSQGNPPQ